MNVINTEKLPFDINKWKKQPFAAKVQMACQAYVDQGSCAPLFIYLYHIAKMAGFVWGWLYFCSFSASLGSSDTFLTWWSRPEAFAKLIAWWMLFENLGLGCASGPGMLRFFTPPTRSQFSI